VGNGLGEDGFAEKHAGEWFRLQGLSIISLSVVGKFSMEAQTRFTGTGFGLFLGNKKLIQNLLALMAHNGPPPSPFLIPRNTLHSRLVIAPQTGIGLILMALCQA
jgi:hypothetical protein